MTQYGGLLSAGIGAAAAGGALYLGQPELVPAAIGLGAATGSLVDSQIDKHSKKNKDKSDSKKKKKSKSKD